MATRPTKNRKPFAKITPDDLRLRVGARSIEGWTAIRVTRSIEHCPNDFNIEGTVLYPAEGEGLILVNPGDPCSVYLGDSLVITGYVDRVSSSINATMHTIAVSGRGKCQDLVDSAAEWPGGQFSNVTALTIARSLAKPYGITVHANASPPDVITRLNISWGETAFEIIERVCRYTALLAYEGVDGNLVLGNVGKGKHSSGFRQGVNVKEASAIFSSDQQFSEYQVMRLSLDSFHEMGEAGNFVTTVRNPLALRNRKKMLVLEAGGDPKGVFTIKRANWECNRRIGRSYVVNITTDSWRDKAGQLYEPNRFIEVDIPTLGISKRTWLIGEVTYRRDEQGTACDLTIMPPHAFDPEPLNLQVVPREMQFQTKPPEGAKP